MPCRATLTAGRFDREDELFTLRVLLDLGVETDQPLQELNESASLLPPLFEHTREPGGTRDQAAPARSMVMSP